jgi:hypothetical protein
MCAAALYHEKSLEEDEVTACKSAQAPMVDYVSGYGRR